MAEKRPVPNEKPAGELPAATFAEQAQVGVTHTRFEAPNAPVVHDENHTPIAPNANASVTITTRDSGG